MNKIYTLLSAVLITASVFAQSPEAISYQAVIRDANNALVTNQAIGMQISILQTSTSGIAVYVEKHNTNTNTNGLVTVVIGNGTTSDDFSSIVWSADTYFIKTETDPTGGTNYSITGTSQLLSVPYALHAKTAETVTGGIIESDSISVGDFAQGGIVFWVDETGQHGLACAKEDQSTEIRWYAGTNGNTQAKGDGPYAGEANTSIIIAALISIGDDGSDYAARVCNELQITEGDKTYGDWYLPSKEELHLMYQNKSSIDVTAIDNSGVAFVSGYYWSSTEYNNINAWTQAFADGIQNRTNKQLTLRVRAVRAF